MTVTGVIAEYNPFHLGHAYHLRRARELTHADYIIVVMSGDFVQRGEPALMNKYVRAQMALSCGADLVIELPVPFSCAGAQDFARGAVSLLDRIGVVNFLVFGSESGSVEEILHAASLLSGHEEQSGKLIRHALREGLSYPAAVSKAVLSLDPCAGKSLLASPNDLLGIEYCRALELLSSSIHPIALKRLGNYHENELCSSDFPGKGYPSASAIRTAFADSPSSALETIRHAVPWPVYSLLQKEDGISGPLFADDFSDALIYRLLNETEDSLVRFLDVTPDLACRIINCLPECQTFTGLAQAVKCKSYTRLRINRALLHCLLGITRQDLSLFKQNGFSGFARVLGFRREASPLLKEIRTHSLVPLILRMKDDSRNLSETDQKLLSHCIFASDLYRMTAQRKYGSVLPNEYKRRLLCL